MALNDQRLKLQRDYENENAISTNSNIDEYLLVISYIINPDASYLFFIRKLSKLLI